MRIAPRSNRFAIFTCRALTASAAEAASAAKSSGPPVVARNPTWLGGFHQNRNRHGNLQRARASFTATVFYQSNHEVGINWSTTRSTNRAGIKVRIGVLAAQPVAEEHGLVPVD